MKKFAKLSLVAAVAVAGLSTANASSLEEAIKGVEIDGMVRYRFTETKADRGADFQQNDYDIELTAKVPVNDMVKAVVKFDVDGDLAAESNQAAPTATRTNKESANANPAVSIEEAYFSFEKSGFVVQAGKLADLSPLTDGLNGTGLAVVAPVGPVTAIGEYMNAAGGVNGYDDVYMAGLLASFQNVNLAAWYGAIKGPDARAYSLAADGTVGPVSLAVGYAQKEVANNDDFSTLKVEAGAEFGMFDVHAGYAKSGDAGTGDLTDGNDAAVNSFGGEQVDIASADRKLWNIGASVSPMEKVTVGLDYYSADDQGNNDPDEVLFTAAYKMSKNFKISGFYSVAEVNNVDTNMGRLELNYTF